jgi:hypothetical protein
MRYSPSAAYPNYRTCEDRIVSGATMPNGQKYEDWFKSKGSGEDGENIGAS